MKTDRKSNWPRLDLFLLSLMVLISVGGCDRKSSPSTASAAGGPKSGVAESVLTTWQQGDQAGAVKRFVEIDWTARPLFAPESVFNLSESQLQTLGASSRKAKLDQLMPQLDTFKKLARGVVEAGRDAAARKDTAYARKCFAAIRQSGQALEGPQSMRIVRLVGQAMTKMADTESAKIANQ